MLSQSLISEISACLKNHATFLITTHVRPDGDAIGSLLAMASWLRKRDKRIKAIIADPVPKQYLFLPNVSLIEINNKKKTGNIEIAIALDTAEKARSGGILEAWGPFDKIINIDHHISNTKFGDLNWIVPEASSTSELVFRLVETSGFPIDQEMATHLYTGILTDTGSFHFNNTSALTLYIASQLVAYGANPTAIAEAVYESRSLDQLQTLGKLLSSLQTNDDGSIAWAVIDEKIINNAAMASQDFDWFIDFARNLSDVKVVFLLKKIKNQLFKISLRSKGSDGNVINVSRLASKFGGGGHVRAAGCEMSGTSETIIRSILAVIKEDMPYAD